MDTYANYAAFAFSPHSVSLSYHGEVNQDIFKFNHLEPEKLEEILYMRNEDLAIDMGNFSQFTMTFWDVPPNDYQFFDFTKGIQNLFASQYLRNLQEVQFKFFKRLPQDQLDAMIQYKQLKSEENCFHFFQMFRDEQSDINLRWVSPHQLPRLSVTQELVSKKLHFVMSTLGFGNSVFNQLQLSEDILNLDYESIFFYYQSNLKLKASTELIEGDESQELKIEAFFHESWFEYPMAEAEQNFDKLCGQLQTLINVKQMKATLDFAFLINEEQVRSSDLMTLLNQLIIKVLIASNQQVREVSISLMPFQIHFNYEAEKRELTVNVNLSEVDPEDMYSEGLLIILQTLIQCGQIAELRIDIEAEEDTENDSFLLFNFVCLIEDFFSLYNLKGEVVYNSCCVLPKKGPVHGKGRFHFLISEPRAMYIIRQGNYIDLQKEILAFIRYLSNCCDERLNSIILSCDIEELDKTSKEFSIELNKKIKNLKNLTAFGILDSRRREKLETHRIDETLQRINESLKPQQGQGTGIRDSKGESLQQSEV